MDLIHNVQVKPVATTESVNGASSNKGSVNEVSEQFSSYLSNALSEVNQQQLESSYVTEQFARGQINDIHHVMITAQKASIALELTVQVRNKAVEAYQEMMRMQI